MGMAPNSLKFQLSNGLRLKGFADFGEELVYFEGLEEHGLEAFVAGSYDAVVGVVAEAGHEDYWCVGGLAAGGGEDVVAGFVGHFDVADYQVEAVLIDLGDGLGAAGDHDDVGFEFSQD